MDGLRIIITLFKHERKHRKIVAVDEIVEKMYGKRRLVAVYGTEA